MCPSPVVQQDTGCCKQPGQHHFIRNERWDDDTKSWISMAGTRLPDNKANRKKLSDDIDVFTRNGMRVRTVKYEVKEDVLGVIFGEGAIPGLK